MTCTKTYFLKNMLGNSCVKLIQFSLALCPSVIIVNISIGEITVEFNSNETSEEKIVATLSNIGFEIIKDADALLTEKIKQAAIELIFYSYNSNSLIRNSDYISQKLQLPYEKLSKVFSKITKTTLEKYIILLKIEKAKEMISSNEFTVSEIAFMLEYSSVHYLSNQFKKITGITISKFKENPVIYRKAIETLLD